MPRRRSNVAAAERSAADAAGKPPARVVSPQAWELVLAHEQLVRNIAGNVLRTLPSNSGVYHRDLVDAGLLGLIQAAARFDAGARPGVIFAGYAKHRIHGAIFDYLRSTRRQRDELSCEALAVAQDRRIELTVPAYEPNAVWMWQAIDRMAERTQRILRMYYIDEMSDYEIAAEFDVSHVTINKIRKHALAVLRRRAALRSQT